MHLVSSIISVIYVIFQLNVTRIARGFRALRRAGMMGSFVSIQHDARQRSISIASDSGRLCRPLLICDNGVPRITPHELSLLARGRMTFADFLEGYFLILFLFLFSFLI